MDVVQYSEELGKRRTIENFICVSAFCNYERMFNSYLRSHRRHSPCATREILFSACRTCADYLDARQLINSSPHGECATWGMPAPLSVKSRSFSMIGQKFRRGKRKNPIPQFRLPSWLCDDMRFSSVQRWPFLSLVTRLSLVIVLSIVQYQISSISFDEAFVGLARCWFSVIVAFSTNVHAKISMFVINVFLILRAEVSPSKSVVSRTSNCILENWSAAWCF